MDGEAANQRCIFSWSHYIVLLQVSAEIKFVEDFLWTFVEQMAEIKIL